MAKVKKSLGTSKSEIDYSKIGAIISGEEDEEPVVEPNLEGLDLSAIGTAAAPEPKGGTYPERLANTFQPVAKVLGGGVGQEAQPKQLPTPEIPTEALARLDVYKGSEPVQYMQDGQVVDVPRYEVETQNELRRLGLQQQLAANQAQYEQRMEDLRKHEEAARADVLPMLGPATVRAAIEGLSGAGRNIGLLAKDAGGGGEYHQLLGESIGAIGSMPLAWVKFPLAVVDELISRTYNPLKDEGAEDEARWSRTKDAAWDAAFLGLGKALGAGAKGVAKLLNFTDEGAALAGKLTQVGTQGSIQTYMSYSAGKDAYDQALAETGNAAVAKEIGFLTFLKSMLEMEAGKRLSGPTLDPSNALIDRLSGQKPTAKMLETVQPTGPKRAGEYRSPMEGGGREGITTWVDAPVQAKRFASLQQERQLEADVKTAGERAARRARGDRAIERAEQFTRGEEMAEGRQLERDIEADVKRINAEAETAFKAAEKNLEIEDNTKKLGENVKTLETLANDESLDNNQRTLAKRSADNIRGKIRDLQGEKTPLEKAPETPLTKDTESETFKATKKSFDEAFGTEKASAKATRKSTEAGIAEAETKALPEAESTKTIGEEATKTLGEKPAPAPMVLEVGTGKKSSSISADNQKLIDEGFKNPNIKGAYDRDSRTMRFNPNSKFKKNEPGLGVKDRLENTREGVEAHEHGHLAYDTMSQKARNAWSKFWNKAKGNKKSIRGDQELREDFADMYSAWRTSPAQAEARYPEAIKIFKEHGPDIYKAVQDAVSGKSDLSGVQAFQATGTQPEAGAPPTDSPVSARFTAPSSSAKWSERIPKYIFENTSLGRKVESRFQAIRNGIQGVVEKLTGKQLPRSIKGEFGAKGSEFYEKLDNVRASKAGWEIADRVLRPLIEAIPETQHKAIRRAIETATIDSLPAGQRKYAAAIRDTMAELGRQMVENGLMTPESFAKWGNRYFAHMYEKPTLSGVKDVLDKIGRFITRKQGDVRPTREETNRLRARTHDTIEDANAAGHRPVDNLVAVTAKSIIDETRLIQGRNFMDWVANEPQFAMAEGDNVPAGWRQLRLPKGESSRKRVFGKLADKMVHPDIAAEIEGSTGIPQESPLQVASGVLKLWKRGKITLSPGAHVNQVLGNAVFLYMDGVPVREVVSAIRDARSDSAIFKEFANSGLIEADYASGFLEASKNIKLSNDPFEVLSRFESSKVGLPEVKGWRADINLYRWEDIMARFTMYRHHRKAGMTSRQAVDHVNENFPNYANVPQKVKNWEAGPYGVLFPTFQYEAARIMGKHLLSPMGLYRYGKIYAAKMLLDSWIQNTLGYSDEDYDKIKKASHATDMDIVTPWKVGDRALMFSTNYGMPFSEVLEPLTVALRGDYGEAASKLAKNGIDKLLSAPLVRTFVKAQTGIDPFSEKELWDPYDPAEKKMKSWAWESAKDWSPAVITALLQEIDVHERNQRMGYEPKSLGESAAKILGTKGKLLQKPETAKRIVGYRQKRESEAEQRYLRRNR